MELSNIADADGARFLFNRSKFFLHHDFEGYNSFFFLKNLGVSLVNQNRFEVRATESLWAIDGVARAGYYRNFFYPFSAQLNDFFSFNYAFGSVANFS